MNRLTGLVVALAVYVLMARGFVREMRARWAR